MRFSTEIDLSWSERVLNIIDTGAYTVNRKKAETLSVKLSIARKESRLCCFMLTIKLT